ncbi:MAG: lysylphosphatidylglycerol synthase transmembrane domain-containing protein [Myxococcota bacterium]
MLRRTLYGVAAGVLLYVGAMVYFDLGPVQATLRDYPWGMFGLALLASATNYLLRFAKWELALGWLDVRAEAPNLTRGRSLLIYLAGLSMSVTPGKVGEVLRSVLLKSSDGVAFNRTAPVVIADRLTDLVALVLLSLIGVSRFPEAAPVVVVTIVLVVLGVLVLGSPTLLRRCLELARKLPLVGRFVDKAEGLVESTTTLLRLRYLTVLSLLSVVGWGLECVGFWLIVDAFVGVDADLATCTFLWSAGTLFGALSFLPGGLGATEGSLVLATQQLVMGVTQPVALAATLLGRFATLWFGELVGGVALALFLRDPALRARAAEAAAERED